MERLFVLEDDGVEREIADSTQHEALTRDLASGAKLSRVEGSKRVILNASEEAAERARWSTHDAVRAIRDARTVVVTIDDGVMPVLEETIELQTSITPAARIKVKGRIAAKHGTDQTSVLVESLVEYKNRKSVS